LSAGYREGGTVNDQSEIYERIAKVVAETLKVDRARITPNSQFIVDLGADSVDMFTLLTQLEDEFGATISDEDAEKLKTVGAVHEYIKEKADAQPSPGE
jgi:acyl carrier protein